MTEINGVVGEIAASAREQPTALNDGEGAGDVPVRSAPRALAPRSAGRSVARASAPLRR